MKRFIGLLSFGVLITCPASAQLTDSKDQSHDLHGRVASVRIEAAKISKTDGAEEKLGERVVSFNDDGDPSEVIFYDEKGFIKHSMTLVYDERRKMTELLKFDSFGKLKERVVHIYREDGSVLGEEYDGSGNHVATWNLEPNSTPLFETFKQHYEPDRTSVYKRDEKRNWVKRLDYVWPAEEDAPTAYFVEKRTITYRENQGKGSDNGNK